MDAETTRQTVRVTIFNQTYSVVTAGDPAETLELAHQVDELMSNIAKRAGNLDTTRTAVLACLHLADQLHNIESELASLKDRVEQKSRSISSLLDRVIADE